MSDQFATQIQIGGRVSRGILPGLMHAISEEQLLNAWGQAVRSIDTEEELLQCIADGHLEFYDEEQPWGQFEELERFLVENDIAFDRSHSPRYEYNGEIVRFRSGMEAPMSAIYSGSGTILVEVEEVRKVRDKLKACGTIEDAKKVVMALDVLCAEADIEALDPFEIVD